MRKWECHPTPITERVGRTAIARMRAALGTIFPIIGLSIAGAFAIIMSLDAPKKEDIDNAESNLESARELRDISFQTQGTLYDLARFGGRLRPGEIEKATADFERSAKNVDDARKRRDQVRVGRKPIWGSAVVVGICVVFLRLISKAAAIVLITAGLAVAAYFFFFFSTAIDGIHNLGLLQDRLLGCIFGLAVFVTGVLVGLVKRRNG